MLSNYSSLSFTFFSFVIPHTKDIKIIICANVRALNFIFFYNVLLVGWIRFRLGYASQLAYVYGIECKKAILLELGIGI